MSQISNINFKKSVELAKNPTETALETQNEPKARQDLAKKKSPNKKQTLGCFKAIKRKKKAILKLKK